MLYPNLCYNKVCYNGTALYYEQLNYHDLSLCVSSVIVNCTLYVFNEAINIGILNLFASGTWESYFSSRGVLNGTNFPARKSGFSKYHGINIYRSDSISNYQYNAKVTCAINRKAAMSIVSEIVFPLWQ